MHCLAFTKPSEGRLYALGSMVQLYTWWHPPVYGRVILGASAWFFQLCPVATPARPPLHLSCLLPDTLGMCPKAQAFWYQFPCFDSVMGLQRLYCRNMASVQVSVSLQPPTLLSFKRVRIWVASLSLLDDHIGDSRIYCLIYCRGWGILASVASGYVILD